MITRLFIVALAAMAAALGGQTAAAAKQPHVVFAMLDDFGWNNIGFHASSQPNAREVVTPTMDTLASQGSYC